MKKVLLITIIFNLVVLGSFSQSVSAKKAKVIELKSPSTISMTLSDAIKARRTSRTYNAKEKVSIQELSNILYAMQGLTDGTKRTVASFYGLYPLNVYVIVKNVDKVKSGLYQLDVDNFKLKLIKKGDLAKAFAAACYGQKTVELSQVSIVLTGVPSRFEPKLGKAPGVEKWAFFEAGEATQNAFLMAAAQGLNTTPVGGYDPAKVADFLKIDNKTELPLIVTNFGK